MTVKELRTLTGMSQAAFAKYFNIPLRSIQNWEMVGNESRKCPEYLISLMEYKLKKEKLI